MQAFQAQEEDQKKLSRTVALIKKDYDSAILNYLRIINFKPQQKESLIRFLGAKLYQRNM